jgi:hypothetical protein
MNIISKKIMIKKNFCLRAFLIISIILISYFSYLLNSKKLSFQINKSQIKIMKQKSNISKWIVVTSINNPTKQLDKLTNEKEFQLLVIADLKTNKTWSHENKQTIYLDVNNQTNLYYSILESTPFNSYTRKNIGYLYAIQNGAKFIYDTDDDNEPLINLVDYFDLNEFKTELEYDLNSPLILNPYAHFGQPTIWPRGFPLNEINKRLYNDYILVKKPTSIIQQSVVNGDPDVDAIFRLTKTLDYKRIDIKFDSSSPSVRIPLFKLTPFNSQNTLFHYKAFWALYLPHSVTFRLTDIWRSYWAQRLMWLLDCTISFLGPNAYQLRNSHSYLSDYKQEKDMYLKTQDLIQFLYKWKCKFKSFYLCVIDLSEQMAFNNFWDLKEIESIKNWLNDLKAVDYIEPIITNYEYELTEQNINQFLFEFNKNKSYDFKTRYTPRFETFIDIDNYYGQGEQKMKSLEKLETFKYFQNYCNLSNITINFNALDNDQNQQKNLTLLVTFNFEPILNNILFLKQFHQSYFKNIVFCGKNILKIVNNKLTFKQFDSFTLIEYDTINGYLHYNCMSKLIDLNLKTNGILLMSDDVLLKHWNLNSLNPDNYWYPFIPVCKQIFDLKSKQLWSPDVLYWMSSSYGENAIVKTFDSIKNIMKSNDLYIGRIDKKVFEKFIQFYRINSNESSNDINKILSKICKDASDVFYLPKKFFHDFNIISKIFASNQVFFEIAVPTILSGIAKINNENLQASYFWNDEQTYIQKYYNKIEHFSYPFELSQYNTHAMRRIICQNFIADKLSHF